MALPTTGVLSLKSIATEFRATAPFSLSQFYRGGSRVTTNNLLVPASGPIKLTDFYGAVNQFAFSLVESAVPVNLRTAALAAGWNGTDNVLATNAAKISSNTTATAALTIDGSFPNGLIFVNTGSLVGMGGRGGTQNAVGPPGGRAITASVPVSINNTGVIAGGGGGGGGGPAFGWCGTDLTGIGGGGASGFTASAAGGCTFNACSSGSSLNASTGFYSNPGSGGEPYNCGTAGSRGGNGGAWGAAGAPGTWQGGYAVAPGAGGAAVFGSSNVTWLATGTRYGSVG